jgi:hypothetical protein
MKRKASKQGHREMTELANGWTDTGFDQVYRFEHYPLRKAKIDQEFKEASVYYVETINWRFATRPSGKHAKNTVHRNRHYTFGLREAIGIAARIEIDSVEVAENVIGIWPADDKESAEYLRVLKLRDKFPRPDFARFVAAGGPAHS